MRFKFLALLLANAILASTSPADAQQAKKIPDRVSIGVGCSY
jgi:hypothetical protein